MSSHSEKNELRELRLLRFDNICKLAQTVPSYILPCASTAHFGRKLNVLSMSSNMLSYSGSSMFPTLKAGDILRVVQYNQKEDSRWGCYCIPQPAGESTLIVHRVIAVDQKGLRTKGDNNLRSDDWVLSPIISVGRIVSVRRGGRNILS